MIRAMLPAAWLGALFVAGAALYARGIPPLSFGPFWAGALVSLALVWLRQRGN